MIGPLKLLLPCMPHERAESVVEAIQENLRSDAEEKEGCKPAENARAVWS
jgi:hypothetical protein